MGCFRNKAARLQELDRLADNSKQNGMLPISVLLSNEKLRIEELDKNGSRKFWEIWVFCTWTGNKNYRAKDGWSDKMLRKVARNVGKTTRSFLGTQGEWEESFYCKLARDIYREWEHGDSRHNLRLNGR